METGRFHGIFKTGYNKAWCQELFLRWETFLSPFSDEKVKFRKVKKTDLTCVRSQRSTVTESGFQLRSDSRT